jgi:hypothetical protein
MVGELMMVLSLMGMTTIGCSTVIMNLPGGKAMLMALNVSGVLPRED